MFTPFFSHIHSNQRFFYTTPSLLYIHSNQRFFAHSLLFPMQIVVIAFYAVPAFFYIHKILRFFYPHSSVVFIHSNHRFLYPPPSFLYIHTLLIVFFFPIRTVIAFFAESYLFPIYIVITAFFFTSTFLYIHCNQLFLYPVSFSLPL